MKRRLITGIVTSVMLLSTVPASVFAHVVVTPSSAGVAAHTTFNVSVANEKTTDVTDLRLTVPAWLSYVTPTTKDGWTITTTKNGNSVTQIEWTNGHIPVGQRQDFTFSAQTPSQAGTIDWKAYQTYADGTVVSWDQTPTNSDTEGQNVGPYSVTKIADDVTQSTQPQPQSPMTTLTFVLSIVAIVLSIGSLFIRRRK